MIKILFDNQCSLCSKEINYYKSIAPRGTFLWCNIHTHKQLLNQYRITRIESLMSLHAIDDKNRIYKGIDAFCLIWKNLKGWKLLSLLINLPLIYQSSKIFYKYFAAWRFNKLKYCRVN